MMTSPKFADNPAHELDDPYLYWSYCLGRMSTRVLNMHRLVYLCAGGLMVANSLPHLLPVYSRARYNVAVSYCSSWVVCALFM